jgi:hypothetical protein
MRLALVVLLSWSAVALADPPTLIAVDTKQPLTLSAPAGWRVHLQQPRRKDLSIIASITPDCVGGPDITVMISLDQNMKRAAQLLADQYKGAPSTKLHGWDCIERDAQTEVMCAGTLKGLPGVLSVYFATTDGAAFKRLDPGEFTSQVAASLRWKGSLAALKEWQRDATAEAKGACGK